jgi:hypothetical protein
MELDPDKVLHHAVSLPAGSPWRACNTKRSTSLESGTGLDRHGAGHFTMTAAKSLSRPVPVFREACAAERTHKADILLRP